MYFYCQINTENHRSGNKHFPEFEYLIRVYTLPDKEKRGGKKKQKKHDRYEKFKPSSSRYP